MSVTYPSDTFHAKRSTFLAGHHQLKPFLLALVMAVVIVAVSLAFTGLPA